MTPDKYSWINDSVIGEAGCVTVVPAAERSGVLAAFGAVEGSGQPAQFLEMLEMDDGSGRAPILVIEVGAALVVIENNGFQGSRYEVLQAASKASGEYVASSFFWNVNAETSFSAARRGKVTFSVELIGSEDDELDGVPKRLRPRVIEAGAPDADMEAAGLALIARFTKVDFIEAGAALGTTYEIEPLPSALQTYYPNDADDLNVSGLGDVGTALTSLTVTPWRRLAEWATRAAAIEADIALEPAVVLALNQFGSGEPVALPPTIEVLARAAAKRQFHFTDLEEVLADDLWGDELSELPSHPYYEAVIADEFREKRAISHLEGLYLAQRRWAFEAVKYVAHPDSFSSVIGCLGAASTVFALGRTSRGWTYAEGEWGRRQIGVKANPRHQQFVAAATALIAHLAESDPQQALARASAALPVPLTAQERSAAIHADAQAAAEGAFSTYRVSREDDASYRPNRVFQVDVTQGWADGFDE